MDIHINNRKRLIRFLNKDNLKEEECYPLYEAIYIGLTTDRELLYKRINVSANASAGTPNFLNFSLSIYYPHFHDTYIYTILPQ